MSENTNKVNQDGSFLIFNFSDGAPVDNPFAESGDTQPSLTAAPAPNVQQEQTVEKHDETESGQEQQVKTDVPATKKTETSAPVNPLAAAAAKAEEKQAAVTAESLFTKAPVFEYAGAAESIEDTSKTFEELRIEKASDFPELEDGKRVTWTMEYGKIVKNVPTPAKTTIGKMKSEIENSKEFIEALKKANNKDLTCKVKPKITAQSKGIAGYKGVFLNIEDAEASKKPISIVPARDGSVYEIRSNEVGKFIARAGKVKELSEVSAGFIPALPPVPYYQFAQIIAFFRHFMNNGHEVEALVHIYWDKEKQVYKIVPPLQSVSKAHISVIMQPDEALDEERYIHVADIHSHNSMPAYFSGIDDSDEMATRVYMVVGCLDKESPTISARISVGGRFVAIDAQQVIDILTMPTREKIICGEAFPKGLAQWFRLPDCTDFPLEWLPAVNVVDPESNLEIDAAPLCHNYTPIDMSFPRRRWFRMFRLKRGRTA